MCKNALVMEIDTGLPLLAKCDYNGREVNIYNTLKDPLVTVESVKGVSEFIMQYTNTQCGDTLVQVSGVWFFTEFGLYETLLACKQYIPHAHGFYKFIREQIKALRETKILELQSDLREARGKVYEEVSREHSLHIIRTECGVKVSLDYPHDGAFEEVKTHNAEILRTVVRYVLERYSCNTHESHYHCRS
jgi:prophage antirepressor-like protein